MTPQSPSITRSWPPEQGQWTCEDWLRLPDDGFRYEVLDGVLTMSPPPSVRHQNASGNLYAMMRAHVRAHGLGVVYPAPVGVRLPGQPVPVQPDIVFVRQGRRDIVGTETIEGAPDLVVEILSPSTWPLDRKEKFQAYQHGGVTEYWIVDPRTRTVEVFVLEEGAYALLGQHGSGTRARSTVIAGFEVGVDDVFAE